MIHSNNIFHCGRSAFILTCIFVLTIAGCCSLSSQGGGEILVSRPQVFTRQRLLNRRLTEQQWLESQLANKTPTEQSFQGYQDVRTFEGIYNKTNVSFDPLGGRLSVAQNNLSVKNLQNQLDTNALQHQIDILKLRQQVAALQSGSTTQGNSSSSATSSSTGGSSSSSPPTPSASGSSGTSGSSSGSPGGTAPSSSGVFSNPPAVPSPGDIVSTQAKLMSIELLRDQLAWRNAVQAALREQELDDSHDLSGLTLYTLKFDLSVLPGGNRNNQYGKVELTLPKEPKPISYEQYVVWVFHLNQTVQAEAVALQRRLELGQLSQEEKVRLAFFAESLSRRLTSYTPPKDESAQALFLADIDRRRSELDVLAKALKMTEAKGAVELTGDVLDKAKLGAFEIIRDKYETVLVGLVNFKNEPLPVMVEGRNYYVFQMAPTEKEKGYEHLKKKLEDVKPYVSVVDPKEEAQNISDVAATEKLRNMVLSLQALIPQSGITAANYTEYMSRSQNRLQGILRKPLVVAYSDHGEKFGWILGPRFEVGSGGKPEFNHTTVQHSVQASLAIPGWLQSLDICYKTSWVGSKSKATEGPSNEPKATECPEPNTMHIDLPGNYAAITTKLFKNYNEYRTPFIAPPRGSDKGSPIFRLQAKQPGDILIRGGDLWRNPKVFIGAQSADQVTVLPDMNGLSAHSNSIVMPPSKPKENPVVDLSVVTSEGIATLAGAVQIFPDTGVPANKFAIAMESSRVIDSTDNSPLTLSAPSDAVPDAFHQLSIQVRPLLPGDDSNKSSRQFKQLKGTVALTKRDTKILFQEDVLLPFNEWPEPWKADFGGKPDSPGKADSGWLMQAELKMAARPDSFPLETIPSGDGKPLLFALFPNEKASRGLLTVAGAKVSGSVTNLPKTSFDSTYFSPPILITLGNDEVFERAYPGIKQVLQSTLTVRIAEVKDDKEIAQMLVPLTIDNLQPPSKPLPPNSTPLEKLLAKTAVTISSFPAPAGKKDDSSSQSQKNQPAGPSSWLQQRLADKVEHTFRLSIVVSPGVEIPIDPLISITGK